MLSRRPLQSLSIYQESDSVGKHDDVGKQSKPVSSENSVHKRILVGKGKTRSRSDSSGTNSPSGRLKNKRNTPDCIPFTIFEDENVVKDPRTTDRKRVTPSVSGAKTPGRNGQEYAANLAEKRQATKKPSLPKGAEGNIDSYWKDLAEDRRLALEVTLKENQMLYQILDTYKDENEALKGIAAEKEDLEKMLEEFLGKEVPEITHAETQCDMDVLA